jgi:hypothetical protein
MSEQKFHKGDLVQVGDMPDYMKHFTGNCEAMVIGSYADQYGGNNRDSYTLHIKGHGEVSWYKERQLTLIESNRGDLLTQWEAERADEVARLSDLDWIFEHGPEVANDPRGASLQALATAIGLGSLWGSNGEGITYYMRSMQILEATTPYLNNKDKAGWLALLLSRQL